jgi:hypothetical protein
MMPEELASQEAPGQPDADGQGRFERKTATFEQGQTFTSSSIRSPAS